jgi:hypothetical protein
VINEPPPLKKACVGRRGRPPKKPSNTASAAFSPSATVLDLALRVKAGIGKNGSIAFPETTLAPVWAAESHVTWQLLRLHQFACFCNAVFVRGNDGTIVFYSDDEALNPTLTVVNASLSSLSNVARPSED